MKKLFLISILCFITAFLIFKIAKTNKINYLSIGDSINIGINSYGVPSFGYNNYVKNYLQNERILYNFNSDYYSRTINDLCEDIKSNRTILFDNHEYYLKKLLRESDVLVISIGMDELSYGFNNKNVEDLYINSKKMFNNLQQLSTLIIEYAKNNILFIGYYNPSNVYNSDIDEYFYYLDNSINALLKKYGIDYVSIYEDVKGNNYMENIGNYHLNNSGYKMIAEKIINYIKNL